MQKSRNNYILPLRSLPRKDARTEKKDGYMVLHTKPVTGFSLKVNCCIIAINVLFQSSLVEDVIIFNRFRLRINHAETAQLEERNEASTNVTFKI
jgi:hypothetical protein